MKSVTAAIAKPENLDSCVIFQIQGPDGLDETKYRRFIDSHLSDWLVNEGNDDYKHREACQWNEQGGVYASIGEIENYGSLETL